MIKPVKFTSCMNGKVLTVSEGEYKIKPGYLTASNYVKGMKQHFYVGMQNQDFILRSIFNNNVLDV